MYVFYSQSVQVNAGDDHATRRKMVDTSVVIKSVSEVALDQETRNVQHVPMLYTMEPATRAVPVAHTESVLFIYCIIARLAFHTPLICIIIGHFCPSVSICLCVYVFVHTFLQNCQGISIKRGT